MIYAGNLRPQIAIGALDEKIILKVVTGETKNRLGEVTGVTTTDTTLAAYVDNKSKDEDDVVDKQTVIDIRKFITRYKACTVKDKVSYDGSTYDILKIEHMGRKRFMALTCKLVV